MTETQGRNLSFQQGEMSCVLGSFSV